MEKPQKPQEEKYTVKCRSCGSTLLIPLSVISSGKQMICSNCKNIIYLDNGSMFAAKELAKRLK